MVKNFGKREWIELFQKTGLTEEMMKQWHHLFETEYPDAHQEFLQWLQIPAEEITAIRQRSS